MKQVPPFACPICGAAFDGRVLAWDESARGRAGIQRCPNCGLRITYPRLEAPQGEYLETTVEKWEAKYGSIDRGERKHDREQNYREEANLIKSYIPEGRILDIGCNAGWLLGTLQRMGNYHLEGVEPSPVLAKIARRRLGLVIHQKYLHEITERDGFFDGLVATDVIEHVLPENINAFIESIYQLLKPSGYVFIKTPNVRFTALKSRIVNVLPEAGKRFMLRGRDVWDAKEHVIHWDFNSLVRVFDAHQINLEHFTVPLPVETANSPAGARIARRVLHAAGMRIAQGGKYPFFAQDIFYVGGKK